jgi:hypothetical protein
MSTRSIVGTVLMLVGTVGFLLALTPNVSQLLSIALAPAVLILALGTYLVGTDMSGRPV